VRVGDKDDLRQKERMAKCLIEMPNAHRDAQQDFLVLCICWNGFQVGLLSLELRLEHTTLDSRIE